MSNFSAERLRVYSFRIGETKKMIKEENTMSEEITPREAEEKIVELVEERMKKTKSLDGYEKHYLAVLRENPELSDLAIKGSISQQTKKYAEKSAADVSAQVHKLIEEKMLDFNISYEKSMDLIFRAPEHQTLVRQYIDANL